LLSEFLAIKYLCHTNIYREAWLRRADQDIFGRNVSFEAARHSDEAMITTDVDFGIALVLDGPAPDVTVPKVQKHLCDSATGESRPEAD
jgi:predicted nuclease of predicted toxin-antitoxin system